VKKLGQDFCDLCLADAGGAFDEEGLFQGQRKVNRSFHLRGRNISTSFETVLDKVEGNLHVSSFVTGRGFNRVEHQDSFFDV
jgi:hypothetical protein